MKKLFIAAGLLGIVSAASAQEVTMTRTSTNFAYDVPAVIVTNFQTNHPTVTQVTRMPMNDDWWYATYTTEDNMINRVYYNTQPYYLDKETSFTVALPVLNTYVPDQIVREAVSKHGNNIYRITAGKLNGNDQTYYVTLIRNGQSEIVTLHDSDM